MKKELLFLGVLILTMSFASAAYSCDDESEIDKKVKNVLENDLKLINGVGIVVQQVDEAGAIGRLYAEILVDVDKKKIANDTASAQISLLSGNHTVKFTNAGSSSAMVS